MRNFQLPKELEASGSGSSKLQSRISGDIMVAAETSEAYQKPQSGDIIEINPEQYLAEIKNLYSYQH